jgi:hypothetical protein
MNINVNLEVTEESVKELAVAYLLHVFEVNKSLPLDESEQLKSAIEIVLQYLMDDEDFQRVLEDLQ